MKKVKMFLVAAFVTASVFVLMDVILDFQVHLAIQILGFLVIRHLVEYIFKLKDGVIPFEIKVLVKNEPEEGNFLSLGTCSLTNGIGRSMPAFFSILSPITIDDTSIRLILGNATSINRAHFRAAGKYLVRQEFRGSLLTVEIEPRDYNGNLQSLIKRAAAAHR